MLKRRWIYRIALGLAVAVSLAVAIYWYCGYRAYQVQHSFERNQAANYQTYEAAQKKAVAEGAVSVVSDGVEPEQRDYPTYYDLKAQQDMAEWTYSLLGVGIVGLIASAVGIGFVYENLREMRRQSEVAEKTSVEERRAWISISLAKHGDVDIRLDENLRAYVSYEILCENFGVQPANNARFEFHHLITNEEGPGDLVASVQNVIAKTKKSYLASKAKGATIFPGRTAFDPILTDSEAELQEGVDKGMFYVFVTAAYRIISDPDAVGITVRLYQIEIDAAAGRFVAGPMANGTIAI